MSFPRRSKASILHRLLLALGLAWVGAVAGLLIGILLVPEGSGLAAPAIVLGYGVVGLIAGATSGCLLAWRLPPERLRAALRLTLVLVIAAAFAVGARVAWAQDRQPRACWPTVTCCSSTTGRSAVIRG